MIQEKALKAMRKIYRIARPDFVANIKMLNEYFFKSAYKVGEGCYW